MSLKVTRSAAGYLVVIEEPGAPPLVPAGPLAPTGVLDALSRRGFHSTDITDALDAADADWVGGGGAPYPSWSNLHDAEVHRRRGSRDIRER